MVRKNIFYTFIQEKEIVGLKEQCGYEIEIGGEIGFSYFGRGRSRIEKYN